MTSPWGVGSRRGWPRDNLDWIPYSFIHPASREGDQADLPTPQGRRPPPSQLGGGGLAYGLRCCVKNHDRA